MHIDGADLAAAAQAAPDVERVVVEAAEREGIAPPTMPDCCERLPGNPFFETE
jgi:hypothetical protein